MTVGATVPATSASSIARTSAPARRRRGSRCCRCPGPHAAGTPSLPPAGIVGEPFRVVHVLVARQAAVDRLSDQVSEREVGVLAARIGDVLRDQVAEALPLVKLPDEEQATVGGDPRALEFDAEPGVEREQKGRVLCVTHRMQTSVTSPSRANPYRSRHSMHPRDSCCVCQTGNLA